MVHLAKQQRHNQNEVDSHYRVGMMNQHLGYIEQEQEE